MSQRTFKYERYINWPCFFPGESGFLLAQLHYLNPCGEPAHFPDTYLAKVTRRTPATVSRRRAKLTSLGLLITDRRQNKNYYSIDYDRLEAMISEAWEGMDMSDCIMEESDYIEMWSVPSYLNT
jgi:hypothetical protein